MCRSPCSMRVVLDVCKQSLRQHASCLRESLSPHPKCWEKALSRLLVCARCMHAHAGVKCLGQSLGLCLQERCMCFTQQRHSWDLSQLVQKRPCTGKQLILYPANWHYCDGMFTLEDAAKKTYKNLMQLWLMSTVYSYGCLLAACLACSCWCSKISSDNTL